MPRKLILIAAALVAVLASSCAPTLSAPPRLVAAWPRAGASLSVASHTFDLTFNRPLTPELSSAVVWREEDGTPVAASVNIDPADARRLTVRLVDPTAGDYQLHWHVVEARSGEAADGEHVFTLRNESSAPPRIEISPDTADAGEALQLVGSGFAAQTAVQIAIGDDEQPLSSVRTNDRGSFKLEVRVPAAVPLGMQPLSAVDAQGRTATAAVQVRWGGWPPAVATNLGQSGPDAGEVTFTLNVRNRSDYLLEHVRVVMQDPDDATLVGASPTPERQAGTLVWRISVMDRGVVGPFRATYRTRAAAVSHAWLEFRHRHSSSCGRDDCLPAFISESTADSLPVAPAD